MIMPVIEDNAVAGYAIEPADFRLLFSITDCLRSGDYLAPNACLKLAEMMTLVLNRATPLLDDDTSRCSFTDANGKQSSWEPDNREQKTKSSLSLGRKAAPLLFLVFGRSEAGPFWRQLTDWTPSLSTKTEFNTRQLSLPPGRLL